MILIVANARIKGGLSGGDNIYLHLAEHCNDYEGCGGAEVWEMLDTDFKPFLLCYIWKIIKGCWKALFDNYKYEFVYSASDFWMDSLPAFILKLKGNRWVAGFYMFAPKDKKLYYYTQRPIKWLIDRFADVVCVTNETLFNFKKPCVAVHGGIDKSLSFQDNRPRIFDAVFIGRFHYSKGIKDLIEIWDKVLKQIPTARLAIIGGGDDHEELVTSWLRKIKAVTLFGFMGDDRFNVFRQSKMVLYPTPYKYSHFSMAPVEAMGCGCPLIAYQLPVMDSVGMDKGCMLAKDQDEFVQYITLMIRNYKSINYLKEQAVEYASGWDWSVRIPKVLNQIRSLL